MADEVKEIIEEKAEIKPEEKKEIATQNNHQW